MSTLRTRLFLLYILLPLNLFAIDPGELFGVSQIGLLDGSFSADLGSEAFGCSVTSLGDIDMDGIPDVAIGANRRNGGDGAVYVLLLNNEGWVHNWHRIEGPEADFPGVSVNAAFGSSVECVGDIDGDGVKDLAVGAPKGDGYRGEVWIFFLNADGSVKASRQIKATDVGLSPAHAIVSSFGSSISVGAENELLIGAPGIRKIYSLTMSPSGVDAVTEVGPLPGVTGDEIGASLEGRIDINGDGRMEILVGAPGAEEGKLWLLRTSAARLVTGTVQIDLGSATGLVPGDRFANSVSIVGDYDGSENQEIIIGCPGRAVGGVNTGSVFNVLLDATGEVLRQSEITGTHSRMTGALHENCFYGWAVSDLGDINSDGMPEVLAGSPGMDSGIENAGLLFVHRLFKPGMDANYDYHYPCAKNGRVDRVWESLANPNSILVPSPELVDSIQVEVVSLKPAPTLLETAVGVFGIVPVAVPGDPGGSADYFVCRRTLPAVPDIKVQIPDSAEAVGILLHIHRSHQDDFADRQGTKGTFSRYCVEEGSSQQLHLNTVLWSQPRDIFIEVSVQGLEVDRIMEIETHAGDRLQSMTVSGADVEALGGVLRFDFDQLPGGVHGVDLYLRSPDDGSGGSAIIAWAAGYPCLVDCNPPSQQFAFTEPESASVELRWQRIPYGARDYHIQIRNALSGISKRLLVNSVFDPFPVLELNSLPTGLYDYRVASACEEGGMSDFSNWTDFEIEAPDARISSDEWPPLDFQVRKDGMTLIVQLTEPQVGYGVISLMDVTGRSLGTQRVDLATGASWQFPAPDVSGVMLVTIRSQQDLASRKFLLD